MPASLTVSHLSALGVVNDVTFALSPGELVGLIGESGSGKTMTALSIMRLVDSTGDVILGEENLRLLSEKGMCSVRGRRIAMVFQEPMTALNPLMKVGKQVVEAIRTHAKCSKGEARRRAEELIQDVTLSPGLLGRYPHQLSGGQRQRVLIAMALAHNPDVLICDEPTTALDVTAQRAIKDLIVRLVEERSIALLFITHDLGLVAETCDRVLVMREGALVEEGGIDILTGAATHPYTQHLVQASQLSPARPATHRVEPGEEVVSVNGVSKRFGKETVLHDVSLRVYPGQRLGIVGGSGSGKTTLLKVIARLEDPSAGTVNVDGELHMVFQDPMGSLNPRMRIRDILAETLPPGAPVSRLSEVLVEVGLEPAMLDRYPHEFSGGQRQRISIARALVPKPSILLADEPVSALDVSVRKVVLELLDRLAEDYGLTMLFVSHDINVVRSVCTDVVVLHDGRIVEEGPVNQVLGAPQTDYTRALVEAVPSLYR